MKKKNNITPKKTDINQRVTITPDAPCLYPLRNVNLKEDVNYRINLKTIQLVSELADALSETQTLRGITEHLTTFLQTAFNPERIMVVFFNADGSLLSPYKLSGFEEDTMQSSGVLPVSKNVLRIVLQEYCSILSSDAQEDCMLQTFASIDLHQIRSLICAPIGSRNLIRGMVYMDSRSKTNVFEHQDLVQLNLVCRFVNIILSQLLSNRVKNIDQNKYGIVGQSPQMVKAMDIAKLFAREDMPLLLLGETGTGKELFADMIHKCSNRSKESYVVVHVPGLSRYLIESELFGHEKGAFTGAHSRKIGKLETANGGTVFLDEVGDIPVSTQEKLLRVLQGAPFQRVGGNEDIKVNIRIISATNRHLTKMENDGNFREDFLARIAAVVIHLPPLRERREDIPLLFEHFMQKHNKGRTLTINENAMRMLQAMDWKRNIRELEHMVQRLIPLADYDVAPASPQPETSSSERCEITEKHVMSALELGLADSSSGIATSFLYDRYGKLRPLAEVAEEIKRIHVNEALSIAGNQAEAARLLGCSPASLSCYLKSIKSRENT